jgi:hypothetical protein
MFRSIAAAADSVFALLFSHAHALCEGGRVDSGRN